MYPTIDREWVAIIGSREFPRLELVSTYLRTLSKTTVVVTGAWWRAFKLEPTRGVDFIASTTADSLGMITVLVAGSGKDGSLAGKKRNPEIIRMVHRVVAFWDGKSPGTKGGIELAEDFQKPCRIIDPETKIQDL